MGKNDGENGAAQRKEGTSLILYASLPSQATLQ